MNKLMPDWDPYDALIQLDARLKHLVAAHNNLAKKVEEQGHVIDILTEGLTASNKANEILMKEMLSNITDKLKEVK
jgi:hypothetical protein